MIDPATPPLPGTLLAGFLLPSHDAQLFHVDEIDGGDEIESMVNQCGESMGSESIGSQKKGEQMSEDQRKIMWQTQTDELYQCIGEFVVKFERVTFSMSMGVIAMLSRSGLKDQQLAYVLLAGVTADPLRSLFESLSAQTAWLRAAERDQLKTLMARVQKLTKERNDIVHGTWLIDFHNYASHQQDFSTAFGMKYHKNKDGAATKSFERTKDDFAHLIQETDDLRSAIDKLCGRFIFDDYGNQVAFERPTDA